LLALALALALAASTGSARAQSAPSPPDGFGIERFRLAMDRAGLLDVDWADVPGHLSWGVGLWAGFAHDPLVIYDRNMGAVDAAVGRRLTTGLVGSLGLWNRVELGLALDIVGYQATTAPMTDLTAGGIGDVRIAAKVLVVGTPALHLAVIPAMTVPMGAAEGYLRDAGPTFAPEIAIAGSLDRVRAAANLGYRARERVDVAGLVIDDELFARAGVGIAIGPHASATEVSVSTSIAMPAQDRHRNQMAIELLAGASRQVSSAMGAFVAGGLGLDNGFGTPDWRAVVGVRYETTSGDRDGDGLFGAADRCPEQAEDKDGFEDTDGCPDPDNDGDAIADAQDRCPAEPEDKDGFQDTDGCPDPDNDGDGIADAQDRCPDKPEDKDGFEDEDGCEDPSAKLEGRVVDLEGLPISHVTVSISYVDHPELPPVELAAGDDGRFVATVQGGAMKVAASAPEYQPGNVDTKVAPGASAVVTVTLSRAIRQGQLRGQVLSFDGKPLAAAIKISGKSTASAETDAEGMFTVELPEGTFQVVIEAKGYATQRRTVNVKLDGVTVLNADMRGAP